MKRELILFLLLCTTAMFCQITDSTITELRGMDDTTGNTHLFYRIYTSTGDYVPGGMSNNIYHLDLSDSIDTLFIHSSAWEDSTSLICNIVHDFEFWHNNPAKFIYCGYWWLDFEGGSFIKRYDMGPYEGSEFHSGMGGNIELSRQNDDLLYYEGMYKSTDGGNNWSKSDLPFYELVSVSPYNDNEIFVKDNNGLLERSVDGCKTFIMVDTTFCSSNSSLPHFYYDKDSVHIYRTSVSNGSYYLSVSDKNGDSGSWKKKYSTNSLLNFTIDYSKSGTIYLADNKNIFVSADYGDTFTLYKTLDTVITGIYKKPDSDKLYAATKHDIYEVTSSSLKSIKHVGVLEGTLDYYPLHLGDVWIFSGDNYCITWGNPSDMVHVRKVIDKVKKTNNKIYFEIKEEYYYYNNPSYYYERIDTNSGKIFRYNADSSGTDFEYLVDDLTASKGDTVSSYRFGRLQEPFILTEESDTTFINKKTNIKTYLAGGLATWEYKLAKGLGLVEASRGDDNECFTYTLEGAVINGAAYGDTTLSDVVNGNKVPLSYALLQNYPNPFNPSTTITYEIPKSGLVQLKVYDVLGKEIALLVNEVQTAGKHSFIFNSILFNKQLSSGVYIYRLKSGSYISSKKMILLK